MLFWTEIVGENPLAHSIEVLLQAHLCSSMDGAEEAGELEIIAV